MQLNENLHYPAKKYPVQQAAFCTNEGWCFTKKCLLIMKLTCMFLAVFLLNASGKTISQTINLNVKNATLDQVFARIEQQTGYVVFAKYDIIKEAGPVSIRAVNMPLQDFLRELLNKQSLSYVLKHKTIIVSHKLGSASATDSVFRSPSVSPPEDALIKGSVKDQNGNPLGGATVVNLRTHASIIADADGSFSISARKGDLLSVSMIGYRHLDYKITGNGDIRLVLSQNENNLDSLVVVVGYGTQRRRDVTGAISTVPTSLVKNENPQSLQDIMRSNVPGLSVGFSSSAKPGGSLQIRGKNTINGISSPLIVLDGVIYYGDISDINPNDIASVDVLKDASAVAVYGAKAAEGVIAITTKQGKTGKPSVNISANYGRATMEVNQRPYDVPGYIKFRENVALSENATTVQPYEYSDPRNLPSDVTLDQWLAYDNSNGNSDPVGVWLHRLNMTSVEIANYEAGRSVNWYNMVLPGGAQQNYTASLSGKTDRITYYWSGGYEDNRGLVINNKYSTVRSRLNLEAVVTKFFTMGMNVNFAARNENGVSPDWNLGITNSPLGSIYTDDSSDYRYITNDQNLGENVNPLGVIKYTDRLNMIYTLNSNFYAKVSLPLGIKYQVNFTPNFTWHNYFNHVSSLYTGSSEALQDGTADRQHTTTYHYLVDNLFTWDKTIHNDHHLQATFLINAEKNQIWYDDMSNSYFDPNDYLGYHDIGAGTKPVLSSTDQYYTGSALMGRIQYSYKDKYLLNASLRRDGSSVFGQKHPYGTFPGASVGWVFTKEPFIKVKWLTFGKLRFSYGVNGNSYLDDGSGNPNYYAALANLVTNKYFHVAPDGTVETVSELFVNDMPNDELKWERTASYNLGLDFSVLNDRLSGSIDAYKSKTTNLLVKRALGDVIGFSNVWTNLGEVDNKGLEIALQSVNIHSRALQWNSNFTFALNRNKVAHLYGNKQNILDASGNVIGQREADDITNGWFIGQPLDVVYDYRVLGVYQENETDQAKKYGQQPGDFKIQDVNGDGQYTNADKQFLGTKNPKFVWSLRNDFTFLKYLTLSFNIYSQIGQLGSFDQAKNNTGFIDRTNFYDLPYWTSEHPLNDYARLYSNNGSATFSIWRKKSFVRLSDVSLAYTFPKKLIAPAAIQDLRLYFTVRNAAVYAPGWNFWDPENSGPSPRTYTLGINMTL